MSVASRLRKTVLTSGGSYALEALLYGSSLEMSFWGGSGEYLKLEGGGDSVILCEREFRSFRSRL